MNNKYLICICSGGLGNRLRPLCSCYKYAKLTGRKLLIWWIKDHRCNIDFNKMFENKLQFIDEKFISSLLKSFRVKIYVNSMNAIKTTNKIVGTPLLMDLCNQFKIEKINKLDSSIEKDNEEYIFVFNHNFINYGEQEKSFLLNLSPQKEILESIEFNIKDMNLNKNIIGVHARGSDFFARSGASAEEGSKKYIEKMKEIQKKDSSVIFYLATDDKEYEDLIKKHFSLNQIKILPNKEYVTKKDKNKSYRYNAYISKKAMVDGVVEMYLLSRVNILIGYQISSYLQICKILSEKEF